MYVDLVSCCYEQQVVARPNTFRRLLARMRLFEVTYELKEHLARDVGVPSYAVPLFAHAGDEP